MGSEDFSRITQIPYSAHPFSTFLCFFTDQQLPVPGRRAAWVLKCRAMAALDKAALREKPPDRYNRRDHRLFRCPAPRGLPPWTDERQPVANARNQWPP